MLDDTTGSILAKSIARAGDRVALRGHGEVRTHRELLDHAARFANALTGRGLVPGDHVALMVADRVEAVEAYIGCLIGGFTAVHVNDRLARAEIQAILADADARAFAYTTSVGAKIVDLDALANTDVIVALGEQAAGSHVTWSTLIENASASVPTPARAADDLTIVGYTSGTTGLPKGVMHSERSMVRILRHMPVHFNARPRSRCAFTGTLSFVAGIWGVLLPHLYLGGEISFMAGLDPDEWFDRMVREGSNLTYVPTPYADEFVRQIERRPEVLQTLNSAVHSGSKIPAPVIERIVGAIGSRFIESYGMTETGAPVTTTEAIDWTSAGGADDIYASTGRPMHLVDVTIVSPSGETLPIGETGEITVSSETMFLGYYKQPELTAANVIDGRLRTGDIGRLDAAGYLYVTDRAKDMIVSGGANVFPAEVEAALVDVPGLVEIAIFGVPDEKWGETVVAVAVVSDPSLDEAALIAASRDRIASYKKPTQVRFVDALPRTASLKIDKPTLRAQWTDGA